MRFKKVLSLLLLICILLTACTNEKSTSTVQTTSAQSTPTSTVQSTLVPKNTPMPTGTSAPENTLTPEITPTPTPTPAPTPEQEKADYTTEIWHAVEIPFTASANIQRVTDAKIDVIFTNRETGLKMVMPAFWNGRKEWAVRFAPTETGIWDYKTTQSGKEIGLNGLTGTLEATANTSNLEIYKHGFLKTVKGTRYFMYNDGTPFFYLADTHYSMLSEEFDSAGPRNDGINTTSHFKYIVDKRVEQGFTVYQTQPIGAGYKTTDGINVGDMTGFKKADKYFKYIADKGLVHANAMLCFPTDINDKFLDENYLRAIVRYWVARFGAYPVLWTLGQEVDDYQHFVSSYANGVEIYKRMLTILYEVDPYKHPITAHQLNASTVTTKGGVLTRNVDFGNREYTSSNLAYKVTTRPSAFYGMEGHTWWGAQWRPTIGLQYNFEIPKDYWYNGEGKVAINYESRYHYLASKDLGVRACGWISYLSGLRGYAYGAQDMWYYNNGYGKDSDSWDGVDSFTKEEKDKTWGEMIKNPVGNQLGYLRKFFESFEWYNLVPDFDEHNAYKPQDASKVFYAASYITDKAYVIYFYHQNTDMNGHIVNMDKNAVYTAKWFDPVNNTYTLISDNIKADASGSYKIPAKPNSSDIVLIVTKN